jgi:hypothetical protein
MLIFWELQPHKETRFLVSIEYLLLALSAAAFLYLSKFALSAVRSMYKHQIRLSDSLKRVILIVLILGAAVPWLIVEELDRTAVVSGEEVGIVAGQQYVGRQTDVIGVLIIGNYWFDGGYTSLHRNVTMTYISEPTTVYSAFFSSRLYNYMIVPQNKYSRYPQLITTLEANGWMKIAEIIRATDIWFKELPS